MYSAKGVVVFGPRNRETVVTAGRVATVAHAALSVTVEELLRRLSLLDHAEELLRHGVMLTVAVTSNSIESNGGRLTAQRIEDAKRAEQEIAAAQLREGEFSSRWTINHPEEPTDE